MILEIFITILLIAIFLIVFGYWTETVYLTLIGYTFLFLLGLAILSGITYKTGFTSIESGLTTIITYDYATYSDHTIGYWLCILSAFSFSLQLYFGFKSRGKDDL